MFIGRWGPFADIVCEVPRPANRADQAGVAGDLKQRWLVAERRVQMSVDCPIDSETMAMLEELSEDGSFFEEVLETFMKDIDSSLAAIKGYETAADLPGLARDAHRLKSAAANLGALGLADACGALEGAANAKGEVTEHCARLHSEAGLVTGWARNRPVAA